ncbi:hypothetical protein EV580_6550 [Mycobacterium sp. BK086]|nr:hypothetical protein EV580_6550 [Mycobacterium sp. BK086]
MGVVHRSGPGGHDGDFAKRWDGWSPHEVADRLPHVTAPWYIAAGWALELFTGRHWRDHCDTEIGVPRDRFADIMNALPEYVWDVVGDQRLWPYPEHAGRTHQTWLRDPETGRYHLDVFREPQTHDQRWICRHNPAITLAYDELILHSDGIPFAIPEVVLLFKAKQREAKDQKDFEHVLGMLHHPRRERLAEWIASTYPAHPWLEQLKTHPH